MCSGFSVLRLRSKDGLGAAGGPHKREESPLQPARICLANPLGMEAESAERSQQKACYKTGDDAGDWIWRDRGRGEDLQLVFLLPLTEWPVGFQRMPAGLGS